MTYASILMALQGLGSALRIIGTIVNTTELEGDVNGEQLADLRRRAAEADQAWDDAVRSLEGRVTEPDRG